jgi:predicted ribonuclease YlaK
MKTFVLDTNVLLHDPDSIFSFQDNKVVIPMTVVEELDSFKKSNDERGRSTCFISSLTGDPYQINNPYLDASSNGLTYLVERFKGQDIFGHVTFSKSERSALAALSSELL